MASWIKRAWRWLLLKLGLRKPTAMERFGAFVKATGPPIFTPNDQIVRDMARDTKFLRRYMGEAS